MYKKVVGVDPSLTGTGCCVMEFDEKEISVHTLMTVKTKPIPHPYARISRYRVIVDTLQNTIGDKIEGAFVTVEAYSFLARGSAATALPELGALIRNRLQEITVPWVEIPPTSVKKYGSGSGAAKKDLMLLHVQQKYGHMLMGTGLEFQDSNQGDAFVIALMGVDYARWKQFGVKPDKIQCEVFKRMEQDRWYQLGFDSMV